MKYKLLYGFLLFACTLNAQFQQRIIANLPDITQSSGPVVIGQFSFSLTTVTNSGWVNVAGSPNTGVRTASDSRSGSAIGVSSISTTLWPPLSGQTDAASNTGGQNNADALFPATVNRAYWYVWTSPSTTPNLTVSGLTPGAAYKFQFRGARDSTAITAPTYRWMRLICTDANGSQTIDDINVAGNYYTNARTPGDGLAGLTDATSLFAQKGVGTFTTRIAKSDGTIDFVITAHSPTNASHPYGYLNGLIITKE